MIPLQAFMPAVVADVLRKAPLTPEKVAFAWRTAVGPAVDRATTVTLVEGTLRVVARDQAWRREVTKARPLILNRLSAILGDEVTRLEITASETTNRSSRSDRSGRSKGSAR